MGKRTARYLRVALSAAGSAILLFSCGERQGEGASGSGETMMTEYSENLSVVMSQNGRRSYHFVTPLLEGYSQAREPYREFRKGVKITTYQNDSLSEVDAVLTANYAIYYVNRELWEAKGNVVVEKSDGKTLYTQQLFWNSRTKKIYSNVDSKIVQNNGRDVFIGEGFESDEEFKDWRFRRMKGRMEVEMKQRADSAATDSAAARPRGSGNSVTPCPRTPCRNLARNRSRRTGGPENPKSETMLSTVILIVVMLLLSAFFSGMEIAFTSKNRLKLEIDRKQSRLFDRIAAVFARHPGQYITTILVGNNIALVVYSLAMSLLLRTLYGALGWDRLAQSGSVVADTAISTVIIIFCAEFLPKSVFRNNPNFYYRALAPVIYFFYILLYPVARFTTLLSHGILRLMGRRVEEKDITPSFDREDLAALLDTNNSEPHSEPDNELKLFQNALDFADLRVRDCMVPRVDIESVDVDDTTIEQLTARFVDSKYSRIFVWRKSVDNIIGYVNSKSLFTRPAQIADVMMEVNFVPETMPLQSMLENFIKHRSNIAVVIDEFGGTAGVISLEDVLEQIFGEIEDEHDIPDLTEKQVGPDEYVLSCRLEVKYLNEKYNLGIEESKEYDTLAGLIIFNYEGIPTAGETIFIDGLQLRILRTTRSRIELARVKKL